MIEIVGNELYQWDTGRVAQITGIEVEYVHFANKGDSKAVIMGAVDIHAKIPDFLLQSGKQLCVYAVKDGITVESKTFYVKHRERPENYVYEDDRRNYMYELVANTEEALESMWWAYQDTTQATENANQATENANLAAKNAHEASYKANHTAKSLMVVGAAKGDSIHLDDAIDQFFVGMRIFGKTTQEGIPTPDAPVELESVGDNGSVIVNVVGDNEAHRMIIATPNGLRGIPVASGGNYIDANGQQWICDEIDLTRGVYVQRVGSHTMNGQEGWRIGSGQYLCFDLSQEMRAGSPKVGLCSHFNYFYSYGGDSIFAVDGWVYLGRDLSSKYNLDVNVFVEFLTANPVDIQYVLATPIETPLSSEEIAAYSALHTYRGNTTVFNDASAHMEIEYAMDAKTYIGRLITGISSPSRVVNVSLPAAKWAGSGNLYSQVVSIDGITENSQVNLTPSVEQLAIFYEKDVTFMTENDGGVVPVYVIGQKPTNDYTIKASIVEVVA